MAETRRSRWVLVRCRWKYFDAHNFIEAMDGWDELLERVPRLLMVDLAELKYFSDLWPSCVGPMGGPRDTEFESLPLRRLLTRVSPAVREVTDILYPDGCGIAIVDRCPDDGGEIDFESARCSICGAMRVVEWGPGRLSFEGDWDSGCP